MVGTVCELLTSTTTPQQIMQVCGGKKPAKHGGFLHEAFLHSSFH